MKSVSSFLGIIFLFLLGCATLTTPNGGPKDKAPPILLQTTPAAGQVNFQGKTVELVFDELVKLNKPKEEIIISPSPGKDVEILVKKDRVTITPKEGWQPNTTYSISFREGVQDITESNDPLNLKLAFSTGPTIDSLTISGNVKYVLKNTDAEKITVAIYEQDTFDIFTDAPAYLTQTNKSGQFLLENLKRGNYVIYAFEDKSKNLKVESRTEPYGFVAQKLNLQHNIDSVYIGLVMMDSRKLKINSIRNIGNTTRVRFNKYLREYSIKADSDVVNHYGDNQTEINFWNPRVLGDSIKQELFATDSLDYSVDTVFYVKRTETKPFLENLKFSLGIPTIESETGKFYTTIQFNKPITNINFDSLLIDVSFAPKKPTQ